MKSIIIYYSLTGNTHSIAEVIAKEFQSDLLRIKPKEELDRNKLSKFVWGNLQVIMSEVPELEDYKFDPSSYELVLLGTPVWAFSYSAPINSFLSKKHS